MTDARPAFDCTVCGDTGLDADGKSAACGHHPDDFPLTDRSTTADDDAELALERMPRTTAGIRANDHEWATKGENADRRRMAWVVNREAMLAELHRIKVLARGQCHTSPEWMDVFETLSAACSNADLDYYNVTADRPVWHLPQGWIEKDFTGTPHNQARELRRDMPRGDPDFE